MHDIKYIRQNPEAFDAALAKRALPPMSSHLLKLDEEKRRLQTEIQNWQSEKNKMAKEIGMAKAKGDNARADELILKQGVSESGVKQHEENLLKIEASLKSLLDTIPNLPADDVPVGTDEHGNKEVRLVGQKPGMNFKPKLHDELGVALKMMDFDAAAKISGARFVVLKGQLARMERALANFMLDIHTKEFGYVEHVPPFLVRDNAVYGTGQLPKFEKDLFSTRILDLEIFKHKAELVVKEYSEEVFGKRSLLQQKLKKIAELQQSLQIQFKEDFQEKHELIQQQIEEVQKDFDNTGSNFLNNFIKNYGGHLIKPIHTQMLDEFGSTLWLIPTAEVPLTNLVADTILDEDQLLANPIRMTAYTPCFRSEAGAAGKDTRGMIRQHQFSKVELVSIVHPDKSQEEHERMTACAEEILKRLGLCYRVMLLCTGDMGFSAQKTYDLEVWMPGQNLFREISSCSNCGAFQARRMKARFKGKNSKETQFVHTLNGSGLAIGRTMVAILENYQQADGSIVVPDALKPYMGGLEKIVAA